MTTTRYRYDHHLKEMVQIIEQKTGPRSGAFFMPDIKEFVSPIDGEVISSRSKLRAHERRHGVRQAGDFKKGELINAEKRRVEQSKTADKGVSFKWY